MQPHEEEAEAAKAPECIELSMGADECKFVIAGGGVSRLLKKHSLALNAVNACIHL